MNIADKQNIKIKCEYLSQIMYYRLPILKKFGHVQLHGHDITVEKYEVDSSIFYVLRYDKDLLQTQLSVCDFKSDEDAELFIKTLSGIQDNIEYTVPLPIIHKSVNELEDYVFSKKQNRPIITSERLSKEYWVLDGNDEGDRHHWNLHIAPMFDSTEYCDVVVHEDFNEWINIIDEYKKESNTQLFHADDARILQIGVAVHPHRKIHRISARKIFEAKPDLVSEVFNIEAYRESLVDKNAIICNNENKTS